jgi:pimeloyl-ACP methyl ester carboxylesterase
MITACVPNGVLGYDVMGDGPPVVLLHGGGLNRHMWDAQREPLAASHRVVRVDLRGHGEASTPTEPFVHGEDVAALLRRLDLGPAVLVGVSLGAGVAVDVTLEHPDLVSALVVVGAGTHVARFEDPWALDLQARLDEAARALDAARWVELFTGWFDGPHRRPEDVDPAQRAAFQAMVEHTLAIHVRHGVAAPEFVADSPARLGEISVPVLAIIGELDAPDHHRMVKELADGVAHAESVVIPRSAHHPNMEQPDAFNAALQAFLERVA